MPKDVPKNVPDEPQAEAQVYFTRMIYTSIRLTDLGITLKEVDIPTLEKEFGVKFLLFSQSDYGKKGSEYFLGIDTSKGKKKGNKKAAMKIFRILKKRWKK